MSDDRYYASVFGGQVCRTCGASVMGIREHDEWHDELAKEPHISRLLA